MAWRSALDVDCILVANDAVPVDALRKSAIKLARPVGTKLVIKGIDDSIEAINSGVTDAYRLLIVVESISDAERLCTSCGIRHLNLGGTTVRPGTRQISRVVNVTDEEADIIRALDAAGVRVEIQMVPSDSPSDAVRAL